MKRSLLLLSSLLLISAVTPIAAQDDKAQQIEDIETQIAELESQLKELKGEEGSKTTDGLIGETFEQDNIEVTINDIYLTEERNEYKDEEYENILVVEYTLQNNGDRDYPASSELKLFVDGKQADDYFFTGDSTGTVSAGRSSDIRESFGFDGNYEELELELELKEYLSNKEAVVIPIEKIEMK